MRIFGECLFFSNKKVVGSAHKEIFIYNKTVITNFNMKYLKEVKKQKSNTHDIIRILSAVATCQNDVDLLT